MRRKKHGAERIDACKEILIPIPTPDENGVAGIDPQAFFSENRPLHLEIGCGKGDFACGTARDNPHINLIAMERARDVCCLALEKAMACKESRPDNLRFIIGDADNLEEWFPEKCLDILYLNFSDPWPKAGHAKRRLTHRNYLARYKKLLKDGGLLIFKTDNVGLFDFSLEEFAEFGLKVEWMTRDLHNSERAEGNVMTEYEKNFSEKGFTINSAIVRF